MGQISRTSAEKKTTDEESKNPSQWQQAAVTQCPFKSVYLFGQTQLNVADTADE